MRCWALRTTCAVKAVVAALALLCPLAGHAAPKAAPRPTVHLRATASVRDVTIRLADVARIEATGPAAAKMGRVELGAAPLPGRSRGISVDDVRIRLRSAGFHAEAVSPGAIRRCVVTRASQTVSADALIDVAREFVEGREASGEGQLFVEPISRPRDLVLPVGRLDLTTEPMGHAVGATRRVIVRASVDGKACGRADVSLRVRRMVRVAVAAATILKDQALTADRVRFEERDQAVLPEDAFLEGSPMEHLLALRAIAAGTPITRRMADQPAIIHRGDTVNVMVRTGGIEVGVPVVAMEDGRPEGWLRVLNTQSNREFRARVVDSKTVEAPL